MKRIESELINEIYEKVKNENALENKIDVIDKKIYKSGISKEHFVLRNQIGNMGVGSYSIFNFPYVYDSKQNQILLIEKLSEEIKQFVKGKNIENVLVVGLGNRHINADSLGAKVVKNIIVTRHIDKLTKLKKVSAIAPSVLGLTGIESFDIVSSIVMSIKPDLVIAIDSLCATSFTRLGCSFQINDAILIPGGGVKNKRKQFDKSTLNCNFLSIGVPLVIYANTFLSSPKKSLNNLVVTIKDIEYVSNTAANIISYAINMAINNLSLDDVKDYLNEI